MLQCLRPFFYSSVLLLGLASSVCGYANQQRKWLGTLDIGIEPDQFLNFLENQKQFVKKAKEKAIKSQSQLKILDPISLDILMRQRVNIGFVGYSGGAAFKPLARDNEIFLREVLSRLDPNQFLLVSGATNEGMPGLMYGVANELGMAAMGITSWKSGAYEPSIMSHLLTIGNSWGHESSFFLKYLDIVIAYGGGNQSFDELVAAEENNIPIIVYQTLNEESASNRYAVRVLKKNTSYREKQKIYVAKNFVGISNAINDIVAKLDFFKWLEESNKPHMSLDNVRKSFKDKKLIGFTGWSANARGGDAERVYKFMDGFLESLDPKQVLLVTGGTDIGAEAVVHKAASTRGFSVIGAVAHRIVANPDIIYPNLEYLVPVAETGAVETFLFSICWTDLSPLEAGIS